MQKDTQNDWLFETTPRRKSFELNFKELYSYKDLLVLFIRRDIVSVYKQTVLGPLWFLIQPLLTSMIQFVIFGKFADIPSDGVPYFLFVLAGNILWNYFSLSFTGIAETFKKNQGIFGKVYFPRAIMPISISISNLFKFAIQFFLFVGILAYVIMNGGEVNPNMYMFTLPLILIVMALISMGVGMVVTSITTKYRDFTFILSFGVSLLMYMTPVIYPTSLAVEKVPEHLTNLIYLNPLTGLFDLFRYAFLGAGEINLLSLVWSAAFAILVYIFGLVIFNKTEKSFMDTI